MDQGVCKEEVYKSVFYSHSERLRNFLYYKSGNLVQAEDLVQEAFSKLWQNCASVSIEKAKSYLFTVANNLFINQAKKAQLTFKYLGIQKEKMDQANPQYLMEQEEFRIRLEQAIDALSEEQRTVYLMNRLDKMKYREIAEALGISQKAVEKRMHKALVQLRKIHKKV